MILAFIISKAFPANHKITVVRNALFLKCLIVTFIFSKMTILMIKSTINKEDRPHKPLDI